MEDYIIDSKAVSCEPSVFKGIIEKKVSGRVPFTLEKFGTRKFILVGERYAYSENNSEGIDTGLSTKDFIAFISGFKRSLNNYQITAEYLIPKEEVTISHAANSSSLKRSLQKYTRDYTIFRGVK